MHSLAHLSDDELVTELQAACFDQRRMTARILIMLGDVEERRIHLAAAASSMWDYARRFLLMSHGTAYRFIAGARLCRRYPWLLERIEAGEVFLTTLTQIKPFITDDNVHDLVAETTGKNRSQVDLVLGKWFGVEPTPGGVGNPFPWDAELLLMAERAAQLASHIIPMHDRLLLTKAAYALLIDSFERKTRAKADRPRPKPAKPTKAISRHATREMYEQHGEQCTFVDERTGARCPSLAFLQRDHRHMRCHGGDNEATNLAPRCAAHNKYLAELALGRDYVEKRIRCRQRK